MKKLLFLFLFPLSVLAQDYIKLEGVTTPTAVGDTLTIKLQYFGNGTAKLAQFDFQYNNKLLGLISRDWQITSTSAQKAYNSWNGYKFTPDGTLQSTDLDGQYASWLANNATYSSDSDWSVERITVQDVTAFTSESEFIKYSFVLKDKANSNYSDYTNLLNLNWGYLQEGDGTDIPTEGNGALSLSNILGGDAGNVNISLETNVITNNIGDGTDYSYIVYTKNDQTTPIASGNFDASGQATVQGLENDVEYDLFVTVDDTKTYLDEAVTVSDLALVFTEAIGAGATPNGISTTFDYYIQSILGNVIGASIQQEGDINFEDSYEILAHLQGVTSPNTPFITKAGEAYNISGRKSTYGDAVNGIATVSPTFKPTDSNKSFTFVHGLAGDVNFSHGFEPTSANAAIAQQAQGVAQSMRTTMAVGAKFVPETANIDLISEIVDGKVIFHINSNIDVMVGSQFNIVYDTARLSLENVIFDTGNTMTNFANHIEAEGKVRVGSFDQNFSTTVKTGTPYKLIFTPKVQLQNTAGLITFKVKEGVKADGTQIKFIMN